MIIKCEHCDTNNIVDADAIAKSLTLPVCGACKQPLAIRAVFPPYQPPKLQKPEVQTR